MATDPAHLRKTVAETAEVLAVHQLDLLAQIESQLRAVHRTLRQIEKLRSTKTDVGGELSNGEKLDALNDLTKELNAIDRELDTQHASCQVMLTTVETMRARLREIRTPLLASDATESLDSE
jgi:hypothetical protein